MRIKKENELRMTSSMRLRLWFVDKTFANINATYIEVKESDGN